MGCNGIDLTEGWGWEVAGMVATAGPKWKANLVGNNTIPEDSRGIENKR